MVLTLLDYFQSVSGRGFTVILSYDKNPKIPTRNTHLEAPRLCGYTVRGL